MKNIIFGFLLLALIGAVAGDVDYCNPCHKMINELKEKFRYNFSGVEVPELVAKMDEECVDEMSPGTETRNCKYYVKLNAKKLLEYLKQKATTEKACVALGMCKPPPSFFKIY